MRKDCLVSSPNLFKKNEVRYVFNNFYCKSGKNFDNLGKFYFKSSILSTIIVNFMPNFR